jgi:hypothetical protein
MGGSWIRFKPVGTPRSWSEAAQSREGRRLAFAQLGKDLVHEAIQLIGGLGFADTRLAGKTSGDFRLLHAAFRLSGWYE